MCKRIFIKHKKVIYRSVIIGAVISIGLLSFGAGQSAKALVTPKTALIYGDSLTWESIWAINKQAATKKGWNIYQHSFPGTGICLWNTWLPQDLVNYNPSVVALTTAGNSYSPSFPCMVDESGNPLVLGSPEYLTKWEADLDQFLATVTATGAKVVFFKSPPMKDPIRNAAVKQQTVIAQRLAANYHGVSIAPGILSALSKSGKYTDYKPCLLTETVAQGCVNGQIPIRTLTGTQAGLHLCPAGLPGYPYFCESYSSGEFRFGKTLVNQTVAPPKPILP